MAPCPPVPTPMIMSYLQNNNILCPRQHGLRHGWSCETQLIETIDDFARSLNDSGQTDVIALDFPKHLIRSHTNCLYINYTCNHLLTWIKQFLSIRIQCVILDGQESSFSIVSYGVPQGTVLAPLLFLCYINDLPDHVTSKVRLYADNVLVYTTINSDCDSRNLQNDINKLLKWPMDWQMEFNPKKCNFLNITKKKQIIQSAY